MNIILIIIFSLWNISIVASLLYADKKLYDQANEIVKLKEELDNLRKGFIK